MTAPIPPFPVAALAGIWLAGQRGGCDERTEHGMSAADIFGGPGKLVPIEWCHCPCEHCINERHHLCAEPPTATFHAFMLRTEEADHA